RQRGREIRREDPRRGSQEPDHRRRRRHLHRQRTELADTGLRPPDGGACPHPTLRPASQEYWIRMTKRIVVTGIGASTPLGGTAQDTWSALLAGESGANSLTQEWVEQYELPVTFAMEAKVRPSEVLERVETKRLDPSAQFALISAREAWADAGAPDFDTTRLGVDYSTGIGGLWTLLDAWDTLKEKGPRRVLPMTVPMLMPNAASAAVSMDLDARAFARTNVSACASSAESIANAYELLQLGLADVILAGGTESCLHPI